MVTLLRRPAALAIAAVAALVIAGTALGTSRDVINDFLDNGAIDSCHAQADYEAARTEPVSSQYGDFQGAIDAALATPALVGTPEAPCPEVAPAGEDEDSGASWALIAIPVGLIVVALALIIGRRRRGGTDAGAAE